MIRFRIEGEFLDQFDKAEFALTKQISKIGEIDLRHGDFSTSFKVPLTANNIRILRYTTQLNNASSLNNFDKYNGQIEQDGAIISDGYYQVLSYSPTSKEAELRFFGGNSEWFDLLKDRYINIPVTNQESKYPYNLDDIRHKFNFPTVTGSFSNTEGYVYFPFDSLKNDVEGKGNGNITIDAFNLGVYSYFLFNKIFQGLNINIEGNFLNDSLFRSEATTAVEALEDFKAGDYTLGFLASGGVQIQKNLYTPIGYTRGEYSEQWDGSIFTSDSDADSISFQLAFKSFRGKQYEGSYGDIQLRIQKNGATQLEQPLTEASSRDSNGELTIAYDIVNISFNNISQGDYFTFEVRNINNTAPINDGFYFTSTASGQGKAYLNSTSINAITNYDVMSVLPKIKQSEFIKDVMVRYGVVSQYNAKSRTLKLDSFETIENNIINAPDWTNKIDLSKEINVDNTKIVDSFGQNSIFKYQDDSENDSDLAIFKNLLKYGLGGGAIEINNDFIDKEAEVYESVFSSTSQRITGKSSFYLPFIPIWKIESQAANGDPEYSAVDVAPRVIIIIPNTPIVDINATGGTQISVIDDNNQPQDFSNVAYGYFAKFQVDRIGLNNSNLDSIVGTLNFSNYDYKNNNFYGVSLLERNYNLQTKILNAPYYVSMNMNLTNLDIQELDHLTPIYLSYKYDTGYYYIDSVDQYKGDGTTTKINLVKL